MPTSTSTFSENEKEDLRTLLRINDYSKFVRADQIIAEVEAKGTVTASEYLDSAFKVYCVKRVPDRDAAKARLQAAVPEASDADVESELRLAEMRGFAERDALRGLHRRHKAGSTVATALTPSKPPGEAPTKSPLGVAPRRLITVTAPVAAGASETRMDAEMHSIPLTDTLPVHDKASTPHAVPPTLAVFASMEDAPLEAAMTPQPKAAVLKRPPAPPRHPLDETSQHMGGTDKESSVLTESADLHAIMANLRRAEGSSEVSRSAYASIGGGGISEGGARFRKLASLGGGGHIPNDTGSGNNIGAARGSTHGALDNSTSHISAGFSRGAIDEVMAEEVREWVAKMVGERFNKEVLAESNFVDSLRSGVVLAVLLQKMQDPPVADAQLVVPKRTTGFFARDTVAMFLMTAKKRFSLVDAQMFNNSDLSEAKNDRQVVTCLMSIARIAYTQGVIRVAPTIVVLEREIDGHSARYSPGELDRLVREAEAREHSDSSGGGGCGADGDHIDSDAAPAHEDARVQEPEEPNREPVADAPPVVETPEKTPPREASAALEPAEPTLNVDDDEDDGGGGSAEEYVAAVAEAAVRTVLTPVKLEHPPPSLEARPPTAVTLSRSRAASGGGSSNAFMAPVKLATRSPSNKASTASRCEEESSESEAARSFSHAMSAPQPRFLDSAQQLEPEPEVNVAVSLPDINDAADKAQHVSLEGLVPQRKDQWEDRIDQERHFTDPPRALVGVPKQKITRVVWKVPKQAGETEEVVAPHYRSRRWDGIDVSLGNTLNDFYKENPLTPWRFHAVASNSGEYVMYNRDSAQKKIVFVRFIQRRLFIRYSRNRSGPIWVLFSDAVNKLDDMFAKQ